jgi:DNA modification methylase
VQKNQLYYGDNLTVLREHIKDESVDLIYLDPPFNSRQDYNVLFAEKDGTRSSSQIMAFEDTWEWNMDAEAAYQEIVERGGRVSDAMRAFRTFLGHSDMMAYLAMMAPRLIELHRVLKVTGSIYLHCDPTASHYLKILMDGIFGVANFVNEINWKRLRGVIEREDAQIGVLISMEAPTKPMLKEAAEAGFYKPPGLQDKYPRIQILTIEDLLAGKQVAHPRLLDATFKKAPKSRKAAEEQIPLGDGIEEPF